MEPSQELVERSIKSIKRQLDLLDSADTKTLNLDDMLAITRAAYVGTVLPKLRYWQETGPKDDPHYGIFRARFLKELPCETKALIEPPVEVVVNIGRCNNVGESIFYCSNHFATALIESRAKVGEQWIVGDYDFVNEGSLTSIALGVKEHKILSQSNTNTTPEDFLNGFDAASRKKHRLIDSHLHKSFNSSIEQGSHKYKKTLAATYFLTDRWRQVDSILYPSVASGLSGVNVAIKAEARKRVLKLRKAYYVRIDRLDIKNYAFSYTPLAIGMIKGETISWEDIVPDQNIFLM